MPRTEGMRESIAGCRKEEKKVYLFFLSRDEKQKRRLRSLLFCIHSAFMMLRGDGYSALATAGTCQSMPKVQELSLTAGAH